MPSGQLVDVTTDVITHRLWGWVVPRSPLSPCSSAEPPSLPGQTSTTCWEEWPDLRSTWQPLQVERLQQNDIALVVVIR